MFQQLNFYPFLTACKVWTLYKMAVVLISIYSTIVYLLIVKNLQNVQHNINEVLNLN